MNNTDNKKRVFINYSNHPSAMWSAAQRSAAEEYGEIVDLEFRKISSTDGKEDIRRQAQEEFQRIMERHPGAVMCQGEFTLTYALVQMLQQAGIPVLVACSERSAEEHLDEHGNSVKTSLFRFVRFREYPRMIRNEVG